MSKRNDRRLGVAPWVPGKGEPDGLWRGLDGKLYLRPSVSPDPLQDQVNRYRAQQERPYSGMWRLKQAVWWVLVGGGLCAAGMLALAFVLARYRGYL